MTKGAFMQIPSLRVDDQIALVTGSGRGIGEAIAHGLAAHGAHVVITDLPDRLEPAEAVADAIRREHGREALVLPLDVTDIGNINDTIAATVDRFGRLDILVNNAGINIPQFALEVTEADWDAVLDINLKGLFFCCQAAGRQMIAQGRGKIINIASQMGVVGYQRRAAYCAAKAGVVNLTRVLAFEWAQHGIRVNAIGPTFIETALSAPFWQDEAFKADVLSRIPLGYIGKPEDVIGAAVYLASPAADLVTGHTLLVDGGWTAA
jgi:2-deoxy-D-gluconate 3-dehydrogenase